MISTSGIIWRSAHPFAGPWLPIESAPRDGRVIRVTDLDTCSAEMAWSPSGFNPLVSRRPGIWEATDRSFTWSEDAGAGPTHWRPCDDEMPDFLIALNAGFASRTGAPRD